ALVTLGEWLVDIHGPHEHQSLLRPQAQLDLLDSFGNLETERDTLRASLARRNALAPAKAELIVDERSYAQQLDLLRFQTAEITAARLRPEDESALDQEYQRANNAARLLELSRTALDLLSEHDQSLIAQAGQLGRTLHELPKLDPSAAGLAEHHQQAVSA